MYKITNLAIMLLVGLNLLAQERLDSLWSVWKDVKKADSIRSISLHQFAWDGYLFTQPDSAFYFEQIRFEYAQKQGLKKQMSSALNTQAISFAIRSDNSKALEYYERSLKISTEIRDQLAIGNTLSNIGLIYYNKGNWVEALKYHTNSLKLREEIRDTNGIAVSSNNIGLIYNQQEEYDKALEHYHIALEIYEELGDKKSIAGSLNNIGTSHELKGDNITAIDFYRKSQIINQEIGDLNGVASFLNNIGSLYISEGDYGKALDNFERSLDILEEIGDKKGVSSSLKNIGNINISLTNYRKAIENCSKGMQIAIEIGDIENQKGLYKCLYSAYKAIGESTKALEYHEKMNVIDDSLNSKETAKKLQEMEFAKQVLSDSLKQEAEKRVVQNAHDKEVRKKNQTRNFLAGAGVLFLLLSAGLYSRWRYVRKSKALIEIEKDRSENLLLNILPAEIAEELKEKGSADARDFEMVSILFTDFKEFTEASAKLSAQDLVSEINACFEVFDGIMVKYKIEKIKTIGDAYMAAGGLPAPTNDSIRNTVLAGLEMQAFISKRKIEMDSAGKTAFEMRVGIHTGPVVAGIVGVKKFQYDIWGDTVNTASRMESNGDVGKVNISQVTYELLKEDLQFNFESRGKIEAKGKGELKMYFVSKS